MIEGLVSTVIPVFNRPVMLREALDSVLSQNYTSKEIIIVDDGSTDSTGDVLESLRSKYPEQLHVVRISNSGPGGAREAGRQLAKGEFIQYLDSDDLYLPRKIALQVDALRANPDADIAYGYQYEGQSPRSTQELKPARRTGRSFDFLFPEILKGRIWATSNPLYRRAFSDRVGPWSRRRYDEDLDYDVRAGIAGARLVHVPQFVLKVRYHDGRMSYTNAAWTYSEQTESRLTIAKHVLSSNVKFSDPCVQHFGRALFLDARKLARMGLIIEANKSLRAAREILKKQRGGDLKSAVYLVSTSVIGHRVAARLAEIFEPGS